MVCGSWGSFEAFKLMVWRSLSAYRERRLSYDYLDVYRLVDIFLSKDGEYDSVRPLVNLDIVILVLGLADLPNKLLPNIVVQFLSLRRDGYKPTWVFAPFTLGKVESVYGREVTGLLGGAYDDSTLRDSVSSVAGAAGVEGDRDLPRAVKPPNAAIPKPK